MNKHSEEDDLGNPILGTPIIKNYYFEQDHPFYKGKRSDLYFQVFFPIFQSEELLSFEGELNEDSIKRELKEISIEFKYVQKTASNPNGDEYKRYVKDLCRLLCISKNEGEIAKCYFIVVGEYVPFYDYFYHIQIKDEDTPPSDNSDTRKEVSNMYLAQGQYADLFPFTVDGTRKKVELNKYDFIVKALEDALDPKASPKPDTAFFRRKLEGKNGINKLREKTCSEKKILGIEDLHYVESSDSISLRLVYSNTPLDMPQKIHPHTIVCIWEVSSE